MTALLLALALLSGGPREPSAPLDAARTAVATVQDTSDAALDRRTAEVAAQLRCPVCRNQSVLESSSDLARRMQGVIREKLAAGQSPEEVRAYFVNRYGDWILLQPEARGLNLLVFVLPPLVLLAGGAIVFFLVRGWTGRGRSASSAGPDPAAEAGGPAPGDFTPEEERRLRRALGER